MWNVIIFLLITIVIRDENIGQGEAKLCSKQKTIWCFLFLF